MDGMGMAMGNNPGPVLEGISGLRRVTTLTKMAKKSLKQTRGPLDHREAPATHTKANWGPCQMQEQSRDPQADEPADSPWMLP